MAKNVLITGGTGFIGSKLTELLLADDHQVSIFTRKPSSVTKNWGSRVEAISEFSEIKPSRVFHWVINLAGEPIVDKRWTIERQRLLRDSRITLTKQLIERLSSLEQPPEVLVSGSAVGYYGDRGDEMCDETSAPESDFGAVLCQDWEQQALKASSMGCRVCLVRTGIVLDRDGGALKKMLPPFKVGLGGRIGTGKQWMSWVHREDLCRLILFLLNTEACSGAYNGTSPNPVTNQQFSKKLGAALGRPAFFPVPAFVLRSLLGEASMLLLGGQKVLPNKAMSEGFNFKYEQLDQALGSIVG